MTANRHSKIEPAPITLTSIIINLLPIILVVGVWVFFMSRMKKATPAVDAHVAYMAAHLEETKQLNRTLERIASVLEARQASH